MPCRLSKENIDNEPTGFCKSIVFFHFFRRS